MKSLVWHRCYDDSWRDLIVPEAFAHPAKFAPGLVRRIYAHGLDSGWWSKGDWIADPFGGIAGGGIMAGYAGLNWIGVELEPRFISLGNQNLAMHGPRWMRLGEVSSVKLVQGDSRRFAEIVGLATGIVTSPPYAETAVEKNSSGVDIEKQYENYRRNGGGTSTLEKFIAQQAKHSVGYGGSTGQIGALKSGDIAGVVTSPPYAESMTQGNGSENYGAKAYGGGGQLNWPQKYGTTEGQIGELKSGTVDGVVTSPPFGVDQPCASQTRQKKDYHAFTRGNGTKFDHQMQSVGNISAEGAGETYWQAMAQVYSQCLLALRPGGVLCVVVKDYVQKGQRVPLCEQTLQLLVHIGFKPLERIRAMLVRESVHECMFRGKVTSTKSRKSFFRRLAEKNGSPHIDWEEVLCVRKRKS